ncbi:MAG: PspC domain-containing protein [Actinomycetaceae bacterium]|nr:PspC domain-containing protein [Actinomycetaceae bacterium]
MYPRLYRSKTDRYIAGVCGGIARTYGWDPALVRILALILVLSAGSGLLVYLILWLVIPLEPMGN